jgi:sugar-specific transcriptional regulator TrmB
LNQKELIDKFKSIGFKEYEAKIFLVLFKGIPMSASEIAKECNLIRNSIYDTLKSFAERGYCNEIETSSVLKYQIIDPQIIVDKIEREFNESNKSRITTLKDTFTQIQTHYNSNADSHLVKEDSVELIRGFNKHRVAKYTELVKNAKKEILGMNRIKGIVTEELSGFGRQFVKKGGVIKYIYKISLDFKIMKNGKAVPAGKEDLIRVCESFEKNKEQVRLTELNIPNVGIFDGEQVFINVTSNLPNAKNKQSDLIIKNADFVNNMRDLFEYYWQNSITIEEYKKA